MHLESFTCCPDVILVVSALCAGSPVFVAPEVLTKKYCSSADLWSAGIIAYMLLTARLPWHGSWAVGVADLYAGRLPSESVSRPTDVIGLDAEVKCECRDF